MHRYYSCSNVSHLRQPPRPIVDGQTFVRATVCVDGQDRVFIDGKLDQVITIIDASSFDRAEICVREDEACGCCHYYREVGAVIDGTFYSCEEPVEPRPVFVREDFLVHVNINKLKQPIGDGRYCRPFCKRESRRAWRRAGKQELRAELMVEAR